MGFTLVAGVRRMTRLIDRFTRHPKTNRATELDPATFAHPEEFQAPRFDPWRLLGCGLCLASAVLVGWVISLIVGVF